MAGQDQIAGESRETGNGAGGTYRVAGALTITRAATTAREIEALDDPLTIDLSQIHKMDTVGAWIIYRTVRDRGAKVIGATPEIDSLLEQVAEADRPVQVHPEEPGGLFGILDELGTWMAELGQTLVGLLGFLGATLIGFVNLIKHPKRFRAVPSTATSSASPSLVFMTRMVPMTMTYMALPESPSRNSSVLPSSSSSRAMPESFLSSAGGRDLNSEVSPRIFA